MRGIKVVYDLRQVGVDVGEEKQEETDGGSEGPKKQRAVRVSRGSITWWMRGGARANEVRDEDRVLWKREALVVCLVT